MKPIFASSAGSICLLLAFFSAGYLLRKTDKLPDTAAKTLAVLETNLFLPALLIRNLSANVKVETFSKQIRLILTGLLLLVFVVAIAHLLARFFSKEKKTKNILIYIFSFPNYAYFGYPIIERVFGEAVLSRTILLALPFTVSIYTYGVYLLTGRVFDKRRGILNLIKTIFTPVVMSVFIGILLGVCSVKLPSVMTTALQMAGGCMSPVAMVLTGCVLASFPLPQLFRPFSSYVVPFVRLLVLPLLTGGFFYVLGFRNDFLLIPVIITAMPVGMNVVLFPEADGTDSKESARYCFLSCLFSLVTLPVVLSLISYLEKLK